MRSHLLRAAAGVEVDRSWDLAYASFTGTPQNWFSVGDREANPSALFFKSDGTQLYATGPSSDNVDQYALSTAWDVSTASYTQSFSILSQESFVYALFFKPDGTKMYVMGLSGDDVNEYDLSTAWDVSTASYNQNFSVAAQDIIPEGLFFKDDGTIMYICGNSSDSVHQYALSTAWDVSSAVFTQSFSLTTQTTNPRDLCFGSSGTKMYIANDSGDTILEYSLSTAWDISTATYTANFSVSLFETSILGLFLKPDGTKVYFTGAAADAIWQFSLSTAYDITTASFTYPGNDYFSVAAQEANPRDLFFKSDGTKMYIIGLTGDDVNEYSLSTAWQVSTASYTQNFSVAAQETSPSGLFFKPDGSKMYVTGIIGDDVNEYSLSSPWDVSTASYTQNFSVASEETAPQAVFFRSDGTKMYVMGNSRSVYEYDLSTAWDVSTASYLQSLSVATEELGPSGLFFKTDGTKMYICGTTGNDVNEYTLSTAWDVSTASYVHNFYVGVQEGNPHGLFFASDGTKFFITGSDDDAVWAFTIS